MKIQKLEYDTVVSFNEALKEEELLEKRGNEGWQLCAVLQLADCMTKHFFVRPVAIN